MPRPSCVPVSNSTWSSAGLQGHPLATALVIALAEQHGRNVPYAFNRKEARITRGCTVVGARWAGRVLIWMTSSRAGTAIASRWQIIRNAGATGAVALALTARSAARDLSGAGNRKSARLTCVSIITLAELVETLSQPPTAGSISAEQLQSLLATGTIWSQRRLATRLTESE